MDVAAGLPIDTFVLTTIRQAAMFRLVTQLHPTEQVESRSGGQR